MKHATKHILSVVLALALLFGCTAVAYAQESVSPYSDVVGAFPTPAKTYTASTGRTTTFTAPNGSVSGYIDGTDEITINELYTDGWMKITYPLAAGGNKTAYCPSDAVLLGQYGELVPVIALEQINVSKRSNLSEYYGYVAAGDTIFILGSVGNSVQVNYPLAGGGYKVGWISGSASTLQVEFGGSSIKAYALTTGRITTYTLPDGKTVSGYIDGTDEILITEIYYNGWAKVNYPLIGGGTKDAFCPVSAFIAGNKGGYAHVTSNKNVYRHSDLSEYYGYVTSADTFQVVGYSQGNVQIIYSLDAGGYKMAWLPESDISYYG